MLKKTFKFFFNFCLMVVVYSTFFFLTSDAVKAAIKYNCDDPKAKWNHDYLAWPQTGAVWRKGNFKQNFVNQWPRLSGFKCQIISNSDSRYSYISASEAVTERLYCEDGAEYAECPNNGERCVRPIDCKAIGGFCLGSSSLDIQKNEINCSTGVTKFKYEVIPSDSGRQKVGPIYWQIVRFRCPADSICWKPVDDSSEVASAQAEGVNLPVSPITTPTDDEVATPIMRVSDCCRQIVPSLDYVSEDYTLNHLVQTAINVYECILCIVGALILIMLIFGAVMMMISAGNDTLVAKGKQIISAAVIGGIIVFFSFLIVNFTVKALGAKFVNVERVEINPQGSN